ncbi:non-specific lipid-transfer protein-like [Abrus precatorius]|uniref:Non-specific lipid-transfer protein-like n=1 Tax=Abrus precatorius TaxID=3816 RepID=A0A8B8KNE4_ABRPR|nr:non-specific lipid-transfer protein-like [Abrus precatorius]
MEKRDMGFVMVIALVLGVMVTLCKSEYEKCRGAEPLIDQCLSYFESKSKTPPPDSCCVGAEVVLRNANANTQSRRNLCECLKWYSNSFPIDDDKVTHLPQTCNIPSYFPIDPTEDCNSIS